MSVLYETLGAHMEHVPLHVKFVSYFFNFSKYVLYIPGAYAPKISFEYPSASVAFSYIQVGTGC
jgi:hypothetical protein